jgi:gluconate 5-dehydrogenase
MSSPALFSLAGRRALVTGSTQGIGLTLALALAEHGAEVVLNGRNQSKLDAVLAAQTATPSALSGQAFDVTDPIAVKTAATVIGPIDILINNAGIHRRAPLIEMSKSEWDQVLSTNLTSAFLVSQAFAPWMIERRAGKIINICSLMSDLARPTTGNYAAAKGGLRMLTRAMCAEWAEHNIQINGIAPGYIATAMTAPLMNDTKFDAWIKARTPARRWGTPADLTGAAVFFAGPASNFLNGQILAIDGGLTAVV